MLSCFSGVDYDVYLSSHVPPSAKYRNGDDGDDDGDEDDDDYDDADDDDPDY